MLHSIRYPGLLLIAGLLLTSVNCTEREAPSPTQVVTPTPTVPVTKPMQEWIGTWQRMVYDGSGNLVMKDNPASTTTFKSNEAFHIQTTDGQKLTGLYTVLPDSYNLRYTSKNGSSYDYFVLGAWDLRDNILTLYDGFLTESGRLGRTILKRK